MFSWLLLSLLIGGGVFFSPSMSCFMWIFRWIMNQTHSRAHRYIPRAVAEAWLGGLFLMAPHLSVCFVHFWAGVADNRMMLLLKKHMLSFRHTPGEIPGSCFKIQRVSDGQRKVQQQQKAVAALEQSVQWRCWHTSGSLDQMILKTPHFPSIHSESGLCTHHRSQVLLLNVWIKWKHWR